MRRARRHATQFGAVEPNDEGFRGEAVGEIPRRTEATLGRQRSESPNQKVSRHAGGISFIGYACFAGGTLLDLFGVAGAGLVGAIPGGLFELTFGIWLIARGFASTATVRSRAST